MSDVLIVAPPPRKLGARSRWSFGIGSIAYGVKDNGFATFLLLFYNQVIGLPAASVGLAIMAALVEHIHAYAPATAYVSLIADGNAQHLYAQFGFEPVMPRSIGMALWVKPSVVANDE